MKIIKSGIVPKTWRKNVTCGYCKAELQVGIKDIVNNRGSGYSIYNVRCPTCAWEIHTGDLPMIITAAIDAKSTT
jgi:RNase P subunit RPR2